jgi:hypothetical protein
MILMTFQVNSNESARLKGGTFCRKINQARLHHHVMFMVTIPVCSAIIEPRSVGVQIDMAMKLWEQESMEYQIAVIYS